MSVKFYGKYRAIVTNNNDPEQWGRIKVKCPSVLGDYESHWCMPCVPYLCNNEGVFTLPNVGDGVWIEFEEGKLNQPIYVGGWFNPNQYPSDDYANAHKRLIMKTRGGNIVKVDDTNNSIVLQCKGGAKVTVKDDTITLDGNVTVTGNLTVNRNTTVANQVSANSVYASRIEGDNMCACNFGESCK